MKTLKLDHQLALDVQSGRKTSTWRMFDDKDLSVNDTIRLIDKVDPTRPETWRVIGVGTIHKVIEKRLGDITADDAEGHESFASKETMLQTYRGYYGNDVTLASIIKIIHFDFKKLQQSDNVQKTTQYAEHIHMYSDGGSRGNPGPSACGFVIVDADTEHVLADKGIYVGITTNNQAEYLGLKYGLEEAGRMGARRVDCYMDSTLVVNQMNGMYKVSNRELWPVYDAVRQLASQFDKISYSYVPREHNRLADEAVNRTLDANQEAASDTQNEAVEP